MTESILGHIGIAPELSRLVLSEGLSKADALVLCRELSAESGLEADEVDVDAFRDAFNKYRDLFVEPEIEKEEKMSGLKTGIYAALVLLAFAAVAFIVFRNKKNKSSHKEGCKLGRLRTETAVEVRKDAVWHVVNDLCPEAVERSSRQFYVSQESLQRLTILKLQQDTKGAAPETSWNGCLTELVKASNGQLELITPKTGERFDASTMRAKDQMLSGQKTVRWTGESFVGVFSKSENRVLVQAFVDLDVVQE